MKNLKGLLAGLAATGLLLAQPAQAQEADDFESALGMPSGSGLLAFILVLAAVGVAAGLIFEDDGNDSPVSP